MSRCKVVLLIYLTFFVLFVFAQGSYEEVSELNPDSLTSRYAPSQDNQWGSGSPWLVTETRLKEIRSQFMYWYFDMGGGGDNDGDWQKTIQPSSTQVHKNLNFQLPFFGFRFNYTRISINGYLEFSDPPENFQGYPLTFPVKDWPKQNDPSFIGIFYSKCRIGVLRTEDIDRRKPGVYFRLERDLQARTDQFGVEVRERTKWDIREGIIGAETFEPKHVIIATWKNVSFVGGISRSLKTTNTFQIVLATDEVFTYAIFNYLDLQWTTHTEALGDTLNGEGGVPAFVGFNAGNGTKSYEYFPYSQATVIRDLTERGGANGFKGRHIFRIDENIVRGSCNKDIDGANLPLAFAPESGNMLGGTIVNITGPCFEPHDEIICKFDGADEVYGTIVSRNRAICIQPRLFVEGYVRLEIAIGRGKYKWKGKYFVETPATATENIFFENQPVHEKYPTEIKISWTKHNLTTNENANIRISLWGYREISIVPEFLYIGELVSGILNTGAYTIVPATYRNNDDRNVSDVRFGFLQINLTKPISIDGTNTRITPVIWSRPIPLGWYFAPQWEREHGKWWTEQMCDDWIRNDRHLKHFVHKLPLCPCTLEQALADKGRFLPDYDCDKDANPQCMYNMGAIHCVRSGSPMVEGAEQQCCYDRNHFLMLSHDQMWGSSPRRSHSMGFLPWNEANKVPTLSQWYHDISPKYFCCLWQHERSKGCETFRFERRPTQDCVAYQAPAIAGVFGDPHVITFDNVTYTFNGKGEFVLVRTNTDNNRLDIQARFEQMPINYYGEVRATQLTSVVARGNASTIVEVRIRPREAQWRYRLDVFVDSKRVYFDKPSLKFQHFPGVTVYTPTYILNQSEVVIMFNTGVGVEVLENKGYMTARVYLPSTYINQTLGLFGNWNFNMMDDLTNPDGQQSGLPVGDDFERIYNDFGLKWMVDDTEDLKKGRAMFLRQFGRSSATYNHRSFKPVFFMQPQQIIPPNRTIEIYHAHEFCYEDAECLYDYSMTLNKELAHFTRNYKASIVNLKEINSQRVVSCGVLETPRFGLKSSFGFTPGTNVTFRCYNEFQLIGDTWRECTADGHWNIPTYGFTRCLRTPIEQDGLDYKLYDARIKEIRSDLMYWYSDIGGSEESDLLRHDCNKSSTRYAQKNLGFNLPFFGFRFNYTTILINGYLQFGNLPENERLHPLIFPVKDWPKEKDPSFIGIFYSIYRADFLRPIDGDLREPGVYFRLEKDLQTRTDQFAEELRERIKWDIREGIIGADTFEPKHAIIVTWKNVYFVDDNPNSVTTSNTFQMVIATDEVFTYAIFNYLDLQSYSHVQVMGDSAKGKGGVPIFVGFNAGYHTRSFQYVPNYKTFLTRDLTESGWGNGFKGRHIFRIDENIIIGSCNKSIVGANVSLFMAPESGNMLGGTVVNITGPCFGPQEKVRCRFGTKEVYGTVVNINRAVCVQPQLFVEGYIKLAVSVGHGKYKWKGTYFVESPETGNQIYFSDSSVHEKDPEEIPIFWPRYNLTVNENIQVQISLWGYQETSNQPKILYIGEVSGPIPNTGTYKILPYTIKNQLTTNISGVKFGFLQINLTEPTQIEGMDSALMPLIWSRPIPLAWYLAPQWDKLYGKTWAEQLCNEWIIKDRNLTQFAHKLPKCPCTLDHALANKGEYLPDQDCDKDSNPRCYYNKGAVHCVQSSLTKTGSQQQCCYDRNNLLMLSHDQVGGSSPRRAGKVPTLSKWYHDMVPKYFCCLWQHDQAEGCTTLRYERRPTEDCREYKAPAIAGVFGDPHFITFDDISYTFNGKGEFVLVRTNLENNRLDVQGRFEQMPRKAHASVRATQLTSVVARGNTSTIVEVRIRPREAQWRYRLDVFVDSKRVYFDKPAHKFQHFPGVTVYTPTYIMNQSEVVVMFDTGAGVEVVENKGYMTARVYLAHTYFNQTMGLFGNWNGRSQDDFANPDGQQVEIPPSINTSETLYNTLFLKWMVDDHDDPKKGSSLFLHEYGRTAATYNKKKFRPDFRALPVEIISVNRSIIIPKIHEFCSEDSECLYDYAMTLNRELAHFTRIYKKAIKDLKKINSQKVFSCGVLKTPKFGKKSSLLVIAGTKVTFECDDGYYLVGDTRRTCSLDGHWNIPLHGNTTCLPIDWQQHA